MDANSIKCFICDVECLAQENYLGANIARTLTMQMSSVLAKCLRTIVETENEYFCEQCVKKIEDYDQLMQLSLQIETELYELYRKKPSESCYFLDAEIIVEQDPLNGELMSTQSLKLENASVMNDEPLAEHDTYDEMVVEYLDDFDAQSDDVNSSTDHKEIEAIKELSIEKSPEKILESTVKIEEKEIPTPKLRSKRGTAKKRTNKPNVVQLIDFPETISTDLEIKCQKCSFTANSNLELEEHKTIMHVEEVKKLDCDICGRSYKTKSALCVHLGMHNGRNSHECHICGKTFTQRGALVRHMPMHTGERPHQCDVCGKRFIHYSSFHMHQMIHTNERKKKCKICGSEFRSNSHMTRHMRSHTGEKPFECEICGQKFAQRYNMKTHYNTHQGIHRVQTRNHKCIICYEAFPRREKLNKHLRQDHLISDDDINVIAEHGPESDLTQTIIERLRSTVYSKEEILIEYVDGCNESVVPDDNK